MVIMLMCSLVPRPCPAFSFLSLAVQGLRMRLVYVSNCCESLVYQNREGVVRAYTLQNTSLLKQRFHKARHCQASCCHRLHSLCCCTGLMNLSCVHSRVCQLEQQTAKMAEGPDPGQTLVKCEFSISSAFDIGASKKCHPSIQYLLLCILRDMTLSFLHQQLQPRPF